MKAIKIRVQIPPEREITIRVPEEVKEGPAEVILIVREPVTTEDSLEKFLRDLAQRPRNRSRDDIDRFISNERDGWD